MRPLVNCPAQRDLLHPRANEGNALAGEIESKVSVAKCPHHREKSFRLSFPVHVSCRSRGALSLRFSGAGSARARGKPLKRLPRISFVACPLSSLPRSPVTITPLMVERVVLNALLFRRRRRIYLASSSEKPIHLSAGI